MDVVLEGKEKDVALNYGTVEIPYVWYKDGDTIICGIAGLEHKLTIKISVEDPNIKVDVPSIVHSAVMFEIKRKLGDQNDTNHSISM